ncbi:MAG: NACHT domain-containing protein [Deltaproteobacteria bacterium]|nr:NACHT domain-containing protein [Deltaproteobacteria bacterium]
MLDGQEPPRESITILHLSDMQFGINHRFHGENGVVRDSDDPILTIKAASGKYFYPVDTLVDTLIEDLRYLKTNEKLVPDMVVLSGDLTEWGLRKEFDEVEKFIERLEYHLELPRDRFVMVPGNHDVNRYKCEAEWLEIKGDGGDPVKEKEKGYPFPKKWDHYKDFFNRVYDNIDGISFANISEEGKPPTYWTLHKINDLRVAVAAINSTMEETHNQHYGAGGAKQYQWFAKQLDQTDLNNWFKLGVVHHSLVYGDVPEEKLNSDDFDLLRNKLFKFLHMIMHGHIHKSAPSQILNPQCFTVSTGSAAVNTEQRAPEHPNQYQILKVTHSGVTRYCRAYHPSGSWVADNDPSEQNWILFQDIVFKNASEALAGKPEEEPTRPELRFPDFTIDESRKLTAKFTDISKFRLPGRNERISPILRRNGSQETIHVQEGGGATHIEGLFDEWYGNTETPIRELILAPPGGGKSVLLAWFHEWLFEKASVDNTSNVPLVLFVTGSKLLGELKPGEKLWDMLKRHLVEHLPSDVVRNEAHNFIAEKKRTKSIYLIYDALDEFGRRKKEELDVLAESLDQISRLDIHILLSCREGFWSKQVPEKLKQRFPSPIVNYLPFTEEDVRRILRASSPGDDNYSSDELPKWIYTQLIFFILNDLVSGIQVPNIRSRAALYDQWIRYTFNRDSEFIDSHPIASRLMNDRLMNIFCRAAIEILKPRGSAVLLSRIDHDDLTQDEVLRPKILERTGEPGEVQFFHESFLEFFAALALTESFIKCTQPDIDLHELRSLPLARVDLDYIDPSVYGFLNELLERETQDSDFLSTLVSHLRGKELYTWPDKLVRNLIEYLGMTGSAKHDIFALADLLTVIAEDSRYAIVARYNAARALERIHPSAPRPYFRYMSDWEGHSRKERSTDFIMTGFRFYAMRGYGSRQPKPGKIVQLMLNPQAEKNEKLELLVSNRLLRAYKALLAVPDQEYSIWLNTSLALARWLDPLEEKQAEEIKSSIDRLAKHVSFTQWNLENVRKFQKKYK